MFVKYESKYQLGDVVYNNARIIVEGGYFTKGTKLTVTYIYSDLTTYDVEDELGNVAKGIQESLLSISPRKEINYLPYAIAILFIVSFIIGYLLT